MREDEKPDEEKVSKLLNGINTADRRSGPAPPTPSQCLTQLCYPQQKGSKVVTATLSATWEGLGEHQG